jgi:hypothetical protein
MWLNDFSRIKHPIAKPLFASAVYFVQAGMLHGFREDYQLPGA